MNLIVSGFHFKIWFSSSFCLHWKATPHWQKTWCFSLGINHNSSYFKGHVRLEIIIFTTKPSTPYYISLEVIINLLSWTSSSGLLTLSDYNINHSVLKNTENEASASRTSVSVPVSWPGGIHAGVSSSSPHLTDLHAPICREIIID